MKDFSYKIGDRVILINNPPDDRREGPTFTSQMDKFLGGEYIVTECNRGSNSSYIAYRLKILPDEKNRKRSGVNSYWWDERWLLLCENYLPEELFEI